VQRVSNAIDISISCGIAPRFSSSTVKFEAAAVNSSSTFLFCELEAVEAGCFKNGKFVIQLSDELEYHTSNEETVFVLCQVGHRVRTRVCDGVVAVVSCGFGETRLNGSLDAIERSKDKISKGNIFVRSLIRLNNEFIT
jgi:hypothetical protein